MKHILLSVLMQFTLLGVAHGNPINMSGCSCAVNPSLNNSSVVVNYTNSATNQSGGIAQFGSHVVSNSIEINDVQNGITIDLKSQSIRITFNHSDGVTFNAGSFFRFFNLKPILLGSCTGDTVVAGAYITTSDPSATWLTSNPSNASSLSYTHSTNTFHTSNVQIQSTPPGEQHKWEPGSWVQIDLKFGCAITQVKKGMTWGFAGLSDIWTPSGGVLSQACATKLYHAPHVRLACETFPVDSPQSNYCGMDFSIYQTNATSHILRPPPDPQDTSRYVKKCNPYQGDTECTEKRHVLCIAEDGNRYYNRLPPYDNSSTGQTGYWPNNRPFPYDRPRYKIHAAPINNQPAEYSEGWVGQFVKLSRDKVSGKSLTDNGGASAGDAVCGVGWRMASFDDGQWVQGMGLNTAYGNIWPSATKQSGGWAFHATLAPDANMGPGHPGDSGRNARKNFFFDRYWVKTPHGGNCWD